MHLSKKQNDCYYLLFTLGKMENELIKQSLILQNIMTILKQILEEMKDGDLNEDFYNNLFQVIDQTANATILFLQKIQKLNAEK